ncbi:hypothetical protein Tco_0562204 [Tanacetum coccineum]
MTNLNGQLSKFVNVIPLDLRARGLSRVHRYYPEGRLDVVYYRSGVADQGPMILRLLFLKCKVNRGHKEHVLFTNNRSTKDIQPPVVQVQPQVPNSEPVVVSVSAPMPNLKHQFSVSYRRYWEILPKEVFEEILGDTTQRDIKEILGDTTQIDIEEILGDTTQIDIKEILGDTTQIDIEEILGDTTQRDIFICWSVCNSPQDRASSVKVPVTNVTLSSSTHLLRENTDSFPVFATRVLVGPVFLLGLLALAIDAACAFRAEEMSSLISC